MFVKNFSRKKQPIQQPKFKPPLSPRCKRIIWLEIDKGWYCQNCEMKIDKPKHQIDRKVRRQDQFFSTGLPYANKNITEIYVSTANTPYSSTEDMIDKLQCLKGKT